MAVVIVMFKLPSIPTMHVYSHGYMYTKSSKPKYKRGNLNSTDLLKHERCRCSLGYWAHTVKAQLACSSTPLFFLINCLTHHVANVDVLALSGLQYGANHISMADSTC